MSEDLSGPNGHEEPTPPKPTKRIQIGSRVRIANGTILGKALRARADLRPEPGQMVCAGRKATVRGYRRGCDDRSLYALEGAPGLWSEEWIDPI